MKLILFDIDGTLIDSGGAGKRALEKAFREVFSREADFDGIPFAGMTDTVIIKDILAKNGVSPGDGAVPSILRAYIDRLEKEMSAPATGHVMPGVPEILHRLDEMPEVALGLLTGNIEEGARIKLEPFGLNRHFAFGAFGSDNEDRNRLLPRAVRRYMGLSGLEVPYAQCVVVGDTPWDVLAATRHGAMSLAVATGPYSIEELQDAGADLVLGNLTDEEAFLDIIS